MIQVGKQKLLLKKQTTVAKTCVLISTLNFSFVFLIIFVSNLFFWNSFTSFPPKIFTLLVFRCTDPPKAPGKPNIIDYDNVSVTLQWEPPKDDGGRPILGYVIEKKDKFSADWIEVGLKRKTNPDYKCLFTNSQQVPK